MNAQAALDGVHYAVGIGLTGVGYARLHRRLLSCRAAWLSSIAAGMSSEPARRIWAAHQCASLYLDIEVGGA